MNKRIEDIIAETRLNEILHKNEAEKQKNTVIWTDYRACTEGFERT